MEPIAIESLRPRLRDDVEVVPLPEGGQALYAEGRYLRLEPGDRTLLPLLDGGHTLTDAATARAAAGEFVSVRALVGLVAQLALEGWLANPEQELLAAGLPPRSRGPGLTRLLSWTFLNPALGGAVQRLALLGGGRGPRPGLLVMLAVLSALLGIGFVSLGHSALPRDVLLLGGSHAAGLATLYLGAVWALTARALLRARICAAHRVPIHAAGLRVLLGVVAPEVDCRHIVRAGRRAQLHLALAGVSAVLLALASLVAAVMACDPHLPAAHHAASLMAIGATVVVLFDLCPWARSDLGAIVDLTVPSGDGRRHAMSYLSRRLGRGQGARPFFEGEAHHIMVALASVLWLYAAFSLSARWIIRELVPAASAFAASTSAIDRAVLGLVGLGAAALALAAFVMTAAGLLRVVRGHLPRPRTSRREPTQDSALARETLRCSPLFAGLPERGLDALGASCHVVSFAAGSDVVRQGEAGQDFYQIVEGEAEVLVEAPSGVARRVATLHPGDGFAEVALLEDRPRTATVRARTPLRLLRIDRDAFLAALDQAGVPRDQATDRLRSFHGLREAEIFRHLSPGAALKLLGAFQVEPHAAGDVIMRAGEPGERFFLVEAGRLGVERPDGGRSELGPGDCVGELALLTGAPRNATVTCREPCRLLGVDRDAFRQVLVLDLLAALKLEQIAEQRAGGGPL